MSGAAASDFAWIADPREVFDDPDLAGLVGLALRHHDSGDDGIDFMAALSPQRARVLATELRAEADRLAPEGSEG